MSNVILTVLSVIISTVGNFLNAVGFLVEKIGHKKNKEANRELPPDQQISYIKNRIWILGIVIYAGGSFLSSAALSLGPQSLLVPLESITLVSNTYLANKFLNERLRKNDIIGTVIIIIGILLILVFGPKSSASEDDTTTSHLVSYYSRSTFVVFASILTVLAIADYIGVKLLIKYTQVNNITKFSLTSNNIQTRNISTFFMLSYSFLASFSSSWNQLFTKSLSEIVASTSNKTKYAHSNWTNPLSYFILVMVLLLSIVTEYWRQKALSMFGNLYVVPTVQVIMLIGGTTLGALYFNELTELSVLSLLLFIFGIVINVIGIILITSPDSNNININNNNSNNNNTLNNSVSKTIKNNKNGTNSNNKNRKNMKNNNNTCLSVSSSTASTTHTLDINTLTSYKNKQHHFIVSSESTMDDVVSKLELDNKGIEIFEYKNSESNSN